jgi:hypothetical protein
MTKNELSVGMKVVAISKSYPGASYNYEEFIKKNNNSPVSKVVKIGNDYENKIELSLWSGGSLKFLPEDLEPWSANAEALQKYIIETQLK